MRCPWALQVEHSCKYQLHFLSPPLSFFQSGYFSPKRGCTRVLKCSFMELIIDYLYMMNKRIMSVCAYVSLFLCLNLKKLNLVCSCICVCEQKLADVPYTVKIGK